MVLTYDVYSETLENQQEKDSQIRALIKRQYRVKKYIRNSQTQFMAKMLSCPCGWTLISPQGEEDIKKHAMIHAKDCHPGLTETEDEVVKMIKTV
jgi:predicted small metal-binding protein